MRNFAIGVSLTLFTLSGGAIAYAWSFTTLPVGGYIPFLTVSMAPLIGFALGYVYRKE